LASTPLASELTTTMVVLSSVAIVLSVATSLTSQAVTLISTSPVSSPAVATTTSALLSISTAATDAFVFLKLWQFEAPACLEIGLFVLSLMSKDIFKSLHISR